MSEQKQTSSEAGGMRAVETRPVTKQPSSLTSLSSEQAQLVTRLQNKLKTITSASAPPAPTGGESASTVGALRNAFDVLSKEEPGFLTDVCLCRYLRARDWNVDKAFVALCDTVAWRAHTRPYAISAEEAQSQVQLRLIYRNGIDRQGRPVMYVKPTGYNPDPVDKRVRGLTHILEEAIANMSEGTEKMIWIVDFAHFVRKERPPDVRPTAKAVLHMLESHYPERLAECYICNAPWMLSAIAFILRPFMNKVIRRKLHWLRGSKEDIFKILSKEVAPEQLEVGVGGLNTRSFLPLCKKTDDQNLMAGSAEYIKSLTQVPGQSGATAKLATALSESKKEPLVLPPEPGPAKPNGRGHHTRAESSSAVASAAAPAAAATTPTPTPTPSSPSSTAGRRDTL